MLKRHGNNPKRRIIPKDEITSEVLNHLAKEACYVGSAHHKRRAADYDFHPPANPRPNKSLCDGNHVVTKSKARALFREGLRRGMISRIRDGGLPKYVWAVDEDGRVYEAKIGAGNQYHGYELGDGEDAIRQLVIEEWCARCPTH